MAQSQMDALLIERAGYERRGLVERVAQVDEALRAAGYETPKRADDVAAAPSASRGKRTTKA